MFVYLQVETEKKKKKKKKGGTKDFSRWGSNLDCPVWEAPKHPWGHADLLLKSRQEDYIAGDFVLTLRDMYKSSI